MKKLNENKPPVANLEVCVDSTSSALAAVRGGADRIELCGNLMIGGTTPSPCLFQHIRKYTDIRTHILIRPRFGDFCYSDDEFSVMLEEVKQFKALGAEGIVIGILNQDGSLNISQMEQLVEQAEGMSITLHRAFDVCKDPFKIMEQAIHLGIDTILTSGQANTCLEGKERIRELAAASRGNIRIMAGAGMSAEIIAELFDYTRVSDYHMSGKITRDSQMTYRNKEVHMGISSMSEFDIWETDECKIREARIILDRVLFL